MKKYVFFLLFVLFLSSCASVQPGKPVFNRIPSGSVEVPEKPEPGINIMGKGRVDEEKLSLFLVQNSLLAEPDYARILAGLYIEEAGHEGINHDVAFAQMCLETGFLNFGGLVQPEWNNFCGLGALGPEQPGLVFPDPRTGVRAHIQHLKAYATAQPLNLTLVDPRYRYVRLGSSPTIEGLAGTWAADRKYSEKIYAILQRLYEFASC
ncbi:MAG: glucosaminidase domain-containing protein [Treponema sp.]|nr:glucosaminidase domain-containing protein [Treponema sp.]